MLHFIYKGDDPRYPDTDLATRYIGTTDNPNERFEQHIGCYGSNREKHDWIRELNELGLKPLFAIVEVIYDGKEAAFEREKYWIQHYLDRGCQLLNILLMPSIPRKQRKSEEKTDRMLLDGMEVVKRKCLQCGCEILLGLDEIQRADKLCFYCVPCSLPI